MDRFSYEEMFSVSHVWENYTVHEHTERKYRGWENGHWGLRLLCCMCVSSEKAQQWVSWGGGEEKRRLEVGAQPGIGSGAGGRDWGQGEMCGIAE